MPTTALPPLPPGFVLEGDDAPPLPPLPPGFILEGEQPAQSAPAAPPLPPGFIPETPELRLNALRAGVTSRLSLGDRTALAGLPTDEPYEPRLDPATNRMALPSQPIPGLDNHYGTPVPPPAIRPAIPRRSVYDSRLAAIDSARNPEELAAVTWKGTQPPRTQGQIAYVASTLFADQKKRGADDGTALATTERTLDGLGWLPPGIRASRLLGIDQQTQEEIRQAGLGMQSAAENFSGGVWGVAPQMASGALDLVAPSSDFARAYRAGVADTYSADPDATATKAGQVVGTIGTMAAVAPLGATGGAAVFGATTAGNTRGEIDALRQGGQQVGALDEWTAAVMNGAIEVAAERIGMAAALNAVAKLGSRELGSLGRMLASGDRAGFKAATFETLKAAGVNAGEEAVTQLGQNAVGAVTYKPGQELTEGVGDAALMGAFAGGGMVGIGGGAQVLGNIQSARGVSPFFASPLNPSAPLPQPQPAQQATAPAQAAQERSDDPPTTSDPSAAERAAAAAAMATPAPAPETPDAPVFSQMDTQQLAQAKLLYGESLVARRLAAELQAQTLAPQPASSSPPPTAETAALVREVLGGMSTEQLADARAALGDAFVDALRPPAGRVDDSSPPPPKTSPLAPAPNAIEGQAPAPATVDDAYARAVADARAEGSTSIAQVSNRLGLKFKDAKALVQRMQTDGVLGQLQGQRYSVVDPSPPPQTMPRVEHRPFKPEQKPRKYIVVVEHPLGKNRPPKLTGEALEKAMREQEQRHRRIYSEPNVKLNREKAAREPDPPPPPAK